MQETTLHYVRHQYLRRYRTGRIMNYFSEVHTSFSGTYINIVPFLIHNESAERKNVLHSSLPLFGMSVGKLMGHMND